MRRIGSNFVSAGLVAAVLFLAVVGCGGSENVCVGELTVDGKTYEGRDPLEVQARKNTCSKYCIEGDAGYDRLYQEFVKTPEARKVIGLDKWAAQAQNKKLGEYINQCQQDCLKQHDNGTQPITVKCR